MGSGLGIDSRDIGVGELVEHFSSGKFSGIVDQSELYQLCTKSEIDTIADEIGRIQADFRYAARNYFHIVSKDGVDVNFHLWESQEIILDNLLRMKESGRSQKAYILKARQLGASILIEALGAWQCCFFANKSGLVVSVDRKHAAYTFKYLQGIYKNLPTFLRPYHSTFKIEEGLVFDTPFGENNIEKPGLNSSIELQWANRKSGVGQGMRLTFAHLTEISTYRNLDEIVEEDLKHALVQSPDTIAVLESTPRGAGTPSHSLWNRIIDLGDDSDWCAIYIPWHFEKTRILAPSKGWRPDSSSIAMRETTEDSWVKCSNRLCGRCQERTVKGIDHSLYKCKFCGIGTMGPIRLSDFQLNWYEHQRKNSKDVRKLHQELSSTATEAFITSGEPVFPDVAQDFVNYCVRKPIAMGFFDEVGKFHGVTKSGACCIEGCLAEHDYDDKSLWVWEFPKVQSTY